MPDRARTTSITGIDGTGKTTAVGLVGGLLSQAGCVGILASMGSPSFVLAGGRKIDLYGPETDRVGRLYRQGQEANHKFVTLLAMMAHGILQGRFIVPKMTREFNPHHIISDRHPLVDSVVLTRRYGAPNLPITGVVKLVESIGGRKLFIDDLFLLTAKPETAADRIAHGPTRDGHESIASLKFMAGIYPKVIADLTSLKKIGNSTVVDTETNGPAHVARLICRHLGY